MPADLTVGQFVYVIRKRIRVSPEQAIFMFVRNVLPPTGAHMRRGQSVGSAGCCAAPGPSGRLPSAAHHLAPWARPECFAPPSGPYAAAALMADVYADHKDEDNFLYITYSGENTFG